MYCLYLITDGEHTKAGITNDPKRRLGMLQTGNPKPLSILLTCPMRNEEDARRLEKAVHDKYSAYRMMGEWFNLTGDKMIDYALDVAVEITLQQQLTLIKNIDEEAILNDYLDKYDGHSWLCDATRESLIKAAKKEFKC